MITVSDTPLQDLKVIEPKIFEDERGFFFESYNQKLLCRSLNINSHFVQDNHSYSVKGVLRGLHYQLENPQGKLIRVVNGEVFDVAVDLRRSSSTFGRWFGLVLSSDNKKMLWIPPGFAHGFFVLSSQADFLYKTTEYYHPASEHTLRWDDPFVSIQWPTFERPNLSPKDEKGKVFSEVPLFP